MSIRCVKAVLDGPDDLDGGRLKVLLALAEWSDDEGLSWHCLSEIARRARLKERATQYVLQQLEEQGFLVIERGQGRTHTSRYIVQIEALEKGAIGASIVAPFSKEEKVQNEEEKVQKTAIKGAISDIKGAIAIAPEPSVNHKEPSVNRKRDIPSEPRQHSFPDDFEVTDEMFNKARAKYPDLDIDAATDEWELSMRANRTKYRYTDWVQAWYGAMGRAAKWQQERGGKANNGKNQPSRLATAINNAHRDIYGVSLDEVFNFGTDGAHEDYRDRPDRLLNRPAKSA